MNYDTGLLIDIIESIEGIKFMGDDCRNGIVAKKFKGLTGNLVIIDVTDEDMEDITAKGHLFALGLGHIAQTLFPPKPPIENENTETIEKEID